MLGIVSERNSFSASLLRDARITREMILKAMEDGRGGQKASSPSAESRYRTLERYARDLTASAREGKLDPVIGRDAEILRVIQVLSRRTKNNPVLIGDAGVGKTAIVEGLAQKIVADDVPEILSGKRLMSLDLGAMIAGTRFRGEFEERLKTTIEEVQKAQGEIILFIDELHTVVGAGAAQGAVDASNMLKPALARGELRCIGATTWTNTGSTSKRTAHWSAALRRSTWTSRRWRTPSGSCAGCATATKSTTRSPSRTRRWWPRPSSRIATSPTATCPTRPST